MICITCHILHISPIKRRKERRNEESQRNCVKINNGWIMSIVSVIIYFIAISIYVWSENLSTLGFQLHRPTPKPILFIDIVSTDNHKYEHFHSRHWTRYRCWSPSEWAIISIRDLFWCMEKVVHIIHVVHWMFCFQERNGRLFTVY